MPKYKVRLRKKETRFYDAHVEIDAENESVAMDIAGEEAATMDITWRDTTSDDVDERAPENIEVIEAEEIDEEESQ